MYKLNQNKTPLFSALLEYVNKGIIPFHVPGHKNGVGIEKEFKEFLGDNVFKIDLTLLKMVDSLHHPTGVIKEAQELAADAYGSDACFFSIQGTTAAVQAMILSVVSEGEKIIIPRNVHKSVTTGIIMSGAIPIYMKPEFNKRLGIAQGVTPETVAETLAKHTDAKAVLIINPTYYGVATDIKKITEIVHSYNKLLIVDEAHGPHLNFHEKLPISAMEAGADMCAQSTHKIIGSLTQSSLLHMKKERIDVRKVQQVLNLIQTTSPSYILMASLDCARKQIALEGKRLLDKAIELSDYARKEINKIKGFYCFGTEIIGEPGVFAIDPTKITISCRDLGITGYQLDNILAEKYDILVELSDLYNILAVGSFGDTKESIDKLINALKEISLEYKNQKNRQPDFLDIPAIPKAYLTPRQAFISKKTSISLKQSAGRISGEFLMVYPPGIPILCPGEVITKDIIEYTEELKAAGLYVQGTEDTSIENIKVIN
ncbi:MAG: aminotransferase class I/II-fold pyridoxal phosphate-dependent enzyme [Clostridiales bacterium]|nr:aminotransferase class I/II-fold pyridoxal phosphate-dependent enzyme [Clostridiales bacterium]